MFGRVEVGGRKHGKVDQKITLQQKWKVAIK
jgi:hypothetical protein